jgi:uncharacterized protein (DUF433 family)
MAIEIRKINNVGTGHPVVARLGVQASDLIPWFDIEDAKRKEIAELYRSTGRSRVRAQAPATLRNGGFL